MADEPIELRAESPLVHGGRRVITLWLMDALHGSPDGSAERLFREHRGSLVEGEDYFEVPHPEAQAADDVHGVTPERPGRLSELILLTESGYLALARAVSDDLAWSVRRPLVPAYFRPREADPSDALLDGLRSLVVLREAQLAGERRRARSTEAPRGYFTVLGFARRRGMPMPIDEARRHGKKLAALCRRQGLKVLRVNDSRYGAVNAYPEAVLERYFGQATES